MDKLSKREPVVLGVYGLDEGISSGTNYSNVPKIQFFLSSHGEVSGC